jgi:hypothetical protein
METPKKKPVGFRIAHIFQPDYEKWEGVPRINIYLLRAMFFLMVVFLGQDAWGFILRHEGSWEPVEAMAWCSWAAFSVLAIIGFIHPLKMLPIVMLEILYKVIWLILVAYPLWSAGELQGSAAEGMTEGFLWVWLPIAAMPWWYFVRTYVVRQKRPNAITGDN